MYIHTQWNITQTGKEWNLAICNKTDRPISYYTKWKISEKDNERKTKEMKQSRNRLIDTENKLVVARGEKSRSLSETGIE